VGEPMTQDEAKALLKENVQLLQMLRECKAFIEELATLDLDQKVISIERRNFETHISSQAAKAHRNIFGMEAGQKNKIIELC
jgi:hypothetical protein